MKKEDFEFSFIVINTFRRPILYASDFFIKISNRGKPLERYGHDAISDMMNDDNFIVNFLIAILITDVCVVAIAVKCILRMKKKGVKIEGNEAAVKSKERAASIRSLR